MEEWGRVEASFEIDQDPEGAVAPWKGRGEHEIQVVSWDGRTCREQTKLEVVADIILCHVNRYKYRF
jgi:hypothetical protein